MYEYQIRLEHLIQSIKAEAEGLTVVIYNYPLIIPGPGPSGPSSLDSVTGQARGALRENGCRNSPDVCPSERRHNQNNKNNPQARYSLGYSN